MDCLGPKRSWYDGLGRHPARIDCESSTIGGNDIVATAIVLLNVEAQETQKIAETVAAISSVSEVYSVAGTYDLVAIVRVKNDEELADTVTGTIRGIPGIRSSQTLIAFR